MKKALLLLSLTLTSISMFAVWPFTKNTASEFTSTPSEPALSKETTLNPRTKELIARLEKYINFEHARYGFSSSANSIETLKNSDPKFLAQRYSPEDNLTKSQLYTEQATRKKNDVLASQLLHQEFSKDRNIGTKRQQRENQDDLQSIENRIEKHKTEQEVYEHLAEQHQTAFNLQQAEQQSRTELEKAGWDLGAH